MTEISPWTPSLLPKFCRFALRLGARAIGGISVIIGTLLAAAAPERWPHLTPMMLGSYRRRHRQGRELVLGREKRQARFAEVRVQDLGQSRTSLLASVLLISTTFGPDVTLSAPQGFNSGSTNGWQYFSNSVVGGTGGTTDIGWPTLWGGKIAIQVLADTTATSSTVGNYIQNQIQTVAGPNGRPSQALYQAVLQQVGGSTQDPLIIGPQTDPGDVYISEWIKFQPDLAQKMGPGGWRAFFEFKTDGDFRVASYVYTGSDGIPYWFTHGDNVANGGLSYQEFWSQSNHAAAVPQGQWFHLELFWHRSGNFNVNGGRFWEAINGRTIVDESSATDPTHNTSMMGVNNAPVNRIMIAQDYSGGNSDQKPAYQWVTDLQIWNGIPPSASSVPPGSIPILPPSAKSGPSTSAPACQSGVWRYPNGSQTSGVACLQPNGTWRMAR